MPPRAMTVYFFILPSKSTGIRFIISNHPPQIYVGPLDGQRPNCMWLIHQFGSLLNLGICKEYPIMAKAKAPRNGNPRNTQLATPVSTPEIKRNSFSADLEAEIRRRAYELYEQRGYTPGYENEDWLVAEREILARSNHQHA
jgi:hypothetical protein